MVKDPEETLVLVKMIHCLKSLISLAIMRMMSRTKDQFFSFYNPRYQNMNYRKMGYSLLNLMSPIVILSLLVCFFFQFCFVFVQFATMEKLHKSIII